MLRILYKYYVQEPYGFTPFMRKKYKNKIIYYSYNIILNSNLFVTLL